MEKAESTRQLKDYEPGLSGALPRATTSYDDEGKERLRKDIRIETATTLSPDLELAAEILEEWSDGEGAVAPPTTPATENEPTESTYEYDTDESRHDGEMSDEYLAMISDDDISEQNTVVEVTHDGGKKRPRREDDSYEKLFGTSHNKIKVQSTPESSAAPIKITRVEQQKMEHKLQQSTGSHPLPEDRCKFALEEDIREIDEFMQRAAGTMRAEGIRLAEAWKRILERKLRPKETKEVECQADLDNDITCAAIIEAKKRCKTAEEALKVANRKWPSKAYTCTVVRDGNLLKDSEAKDVVDIIVISTKENVRNCNDVKALGHRVPALKRTLNKGNLEAGSVVTAVSASIVEIEGIESEDKDFKHYHFAYAEGTVEQQALTIYEVVKRVKMAVIERGKNTEIAIRANTDAELILVRKLVDVALAGTAIRASVYGKEPVTAKKSYARAASRAVIVEVGERPFADTVIELRRSLIGKAEFNQIKGCRKTKNGNILLNLKAEAGDPGMLIQSISETNAGFKARATGGEMEKALIYDLDPTATKEEVADALKQKGYANTSVMRLTPTSVGTQLALLSVTGSDIEKARKGDSIRVGWSDGRLKIPKERCYRCWKTGHIARECSVPKEKVVCRQCGKEGHLRKDCSKKEVTSGKVINETLGNIGESSGPIHPAPPPPSGSPSTRERSTENETSPEQKSCSTGQAGGRGAIPKVPRAFPKPDRRTDS